jgi:hypothetical protein
MSETHRHRRFTAEEGAALIAEWHQCSAGESQAAFCQRRQIGLLVLRYWLGRGAASSSGGFVQVATAPRVVGLDAVIGAVRLRIEPGFDPELLRAVVSCLSKTEDGTW